MLFPDPLFHFEIGWPDLHSEFKINSQKSRHLHKGSVLTLPSFLCGVWLSVITGVMFSEKATWCLSWVEVSYLEPISVLCRWVVVFVYIHDMWGCFLNTGFINSHSRAWALSSLTILPLAIMKNFLWLLLNQTSLCHFNSLACASSIVFAMHFWTVSLESPLKAIWPKATWATLQSSLRMYKLYFLQIKLHERVSCIYWQALCPLHQLELK